ncbi:MAG: hypothetical protein ACI88C_002209 [Acidimicrobiales bacterium]|jgi:hypothetical protein
MLLRHQGKIGVHPMTMVSLAERLSESLPLLVNGAMGTEHCARGRTAGDAPEMWNINKSGDIIDVHRAISRRGPTSS